VAVREAPSLAHEAEDRAESPDRRWLVPLVILLAPVVAVLVLRLPLINQLDYADAWFYSAYAWVPKHHFELFQLNYFAVRFPAILPIGAFEHLLGAQHGYVALRYLVSIACGVALYLGARRFASRGVALAAVVLLFLNPFFTRMLLWDYAGFAAVSAGLMGVCLWYWAEDRRLLWTLLPGALLATAVFANALLATALLVFFAVEGVAALRHGHAAVLRLLARLGVSLAAAIGVFFVGYLGYAVTLGGMSPGDLLEPTIRFVGNNAENSSPYVRPVSSWLFHDPRIWGPVVFAVALIAALGREILGSGIAARIAQFYVGYLAFMWLSRFAITSSLIETWWAYNVIAVAMVPAMAVFLMAVARRGAFVAVLVAGIVAAIAARNLGEAALDAYGWISDSALKGVLLLAFGVVLALLVALRWRPAQAGAAAAAFALVMLVLYAPSSQDGRGTTGIFSTSGDVEWKGYLAGKQFIELIRDKERDGRRVFLWYRGNLGYVNVIWADLPQYAQTVNTLGANERVDELLPLGIARLEQPMATDVLVLSPDQADLGRARRALAEKGFGGPAEAPGAFADGGLHYQLTRLTRKP
jgi:hypothetical protein